jgi:hypothetical protein
MTNIDEKRLQRFQFLKAVYDKTSAKRLEIVNMGDIGKELGWLDEITDAVADYLVGEGLIKYWTMGGGIAITHEGIKEVERALENPSEATAHFPAFQYVLSGDFRGAILNVGSNLKHLSQTIESNESINTSSRHELAQLLEQLRSDLEAVPTEYKAQAESVAMAAERAVSDATSQRPNPFNVMISAEGLKLAAQNVAAIATPVVLTVTKLVELIHALPQK